MRRHPDHWFKIHYAVVHPVPTEPFYSLFQAYGLGFLETIDAFARIALLPFAASEFGMEADLLLGRRATRGTSYVTPIQLDALDGLLKLDGPYFRVICSTPQTEAAVEELVSKATPLVWHVRGRVSPEPPGLREVRPRALPLLPRTPLSADSPPSTDQVSEGGDVPKSDPPSAVGLEGRSGDIVYPDLTRDQLRDYCVRAITAGLDNGSLPPAFAQLLDKVATATIPEPITLPFTRWGHNVTEPTETALRALYRTFANQQPLLSHQDGPYVTAILQGATALREARQAIFGTHPELVDLVPYDIVLTAPSLLKECYGGDYLRRYRESGLEADAEKGVVAVVQSLIKQRRYTSDSTPEVFKSILGTGESRALLSMRQDELRAYTVSLDLLAATHAIPVVRVAAGVNLTRALAVQLSQTARSAGPQRVRKMNRLARQLSEGLADVVPQEIRQFVAAGGQGVKLVADAPLEWLSVSGLPLMLRKDCSRIPTTPGNMSFGLTLTLDEVLVPAPTFEEVLIVRGFDPHDPLHPLLVSSINTMLEMVDTQRIHIRVADVRDEAGFVDVLRSFDGALMIFDGHGTAGQQADMGALLVGKHRVDPWALRGRARIPPIVVLSACDTHPLDGSHASTANGFLVAGATTVVATSLPVSGLYSASFVARLLYRLNDYLPMLLGRSHGAARWSEILPGLQRMVYVTELLHALERHAGFRLSVHQRDQVSFQANMRINGGDANWFDALRGDIAIALGRPEAAVSQAVTRWAYWTDALSYLQLGNPERLVIVPS